MYSNGIHIRQVPGAETKSYTKTRYMEEKETGSNLLVGGRARNWVYQIWLFGVLSETYLDCTQCKMTGFVQYTGIDYHLSLHVRLMSPLSYTDPFLFLSMTLLSSPTHFITCHWDVDDGPESNILSVLRVSYILSMLRVSHEYLQQRVCTKRVK